MDDKSSVSPSSTKRISICQCTDGAAYVETIVVLPFLILIWATSVFLHNAHHLRLQHTVQARGCAWQYADQGCQGDVPTGCEGMFQPESGVQPGGLLDPVKESAPMLQADRSSSILSFLSPLLGEGLRASSTEQIKRPSLLGGGNITAGGSFYTLCNEVPKGPLDFMRDLARSYWSKF